MTANLSYLPFHADADNGDPLVGGLVYTYAVGTTTPQTTWSDLAKTTPNANPVVLNSRGEAQIFFDTSLKVIVKTSVGVTVQTIDSIAESAILLTDVELIAIATTTSAANMLPYYTGSGTATTTSLTSFARTILDDADDATVLATIGAATSGHNHSAIYQPLDAELTAIAGLVSATDSMPYFTGAGTASTTTLTSLARTILDDTTESAVRATIGAQASDAVLTSLSGLTLAAGNILYATDADTLAVLAPGAEGYLLATHGTSPPTWVAPAGGGAQPLSGNLTSLSNLGTVSTLTSLEGLSLTAGNILYATGADSLAVLAPGTNSTYLTCHGPNPPTWEPAGPGSGDMALGSQQTVTATKSFVNSLLIQGNTAFNGTLLLSALTGYGSVNATFPSYTGDVVVSPLGANVLNAAERKYLFLNTPGNNESKLILGNDSQSPYGVMYKGAESPDRLRIFAGTDRNVEIGGFDHTTFTRRYWFPCGATNAYVAEKGGGSENWIIPSDSRLKENIADADLTRCYLIVKSLPLRTFSLRPEWFPGDQNATKLREGWVADEVEAFLPDSILKRKNESSEGNVIEDCRSLDSGQIIKMLYGAVQRLMQDVETLKTRLPEG